MPTFAGSMLELALESTNSSPESADSITDFMRVGRLPISNMFNSNRPIQSTRVGRLLPSDNCKLVIYIGPNDMIVYAG